jgi:hypothetical protein
MVKKADILEFNLKELMKDTRRLRNYIISEVNKLWEDVKEEDFIFSLTNDPEELEQDRRENLLQLKENLKSFSYNLLKDNKLALDDLSIDYFNNNQDEILEYIASNLKKITKSQKHNLTLEGLKVQYSVIYINSILSECIGYMKKFI